MSHGKSRPSSQFTIGSLMTDIALVGIFLAGISHGKTPLGTIMAWFAGAYLVLKFFHWLAMGPLDRYFARRPARPQVERSPISLSSRRGEIRAMMKEGIEKYNEGRSDEVESIAHKILANHPANLDGAYLLSVALMMKGDLEEVRWILLDLLEDPHLNPKMRPILCNDLAWACFLTADPDLKEDADSYSAECMRALGPGRPGRLLSLGSH